MDYPQNIVMQDGHVLLNEFVHASTDYLNAHFDKHAVVDEHLFLVMDEAGQVVDFDSGDDAYADTHYPGHWQRFITPSVPTNIISYRQLQKRIGMARMSQIYTEAMTHPMLQMWRDYIMANPEHIETDSEEFRMGLDMLIGLEAVNFTAEDKVKMLSGQPLE